MKINSENLWKYINELATNEKVKFNVYYDDQYVTQIYWNGERFEWDTGTFTSEAFFNPFYDFIVIEEEKKIPEKLKWNEKSQHNVVTDNTKKTLEHLLSRSEQLKKSINEIIDYLKSKGDE